MYEKLLEVDFHSVHPLRNQANTLFYINIKKKHITDMVDYNKILTVSNFILWGKCTSDVLTNFHLIDVH